MTRRRAAGVAPLRRVLAVLAVAVAATLVLLGPGAPAASAHDALVAATPADGSSTATAPADVTLQFSGVVQELGAEAVVTGPDGAVVGRGAPEIVDSTLTQSLAPDLPGGTYAVAWRVTSADGHPISGTTTFTVTGGADQPVAEVSAVRPAEPSSSGPVVAIVAGVVLVLALGLGARQLRGRR